MTFASPIALAVALILWIGVCAALLLRRRTTLHRLTKSLLIFGTALLALAVGGLACEWPAPRVVVVLVDNSASTRNALYRDPEIFRQRAAALLGTARHVIISFSDDSAERTEFKPPRADAILLFSDAQFDAPIQATPLPPIYIAVDPNLEHPDDAAVTQLEWRDNYLVAAVSNGGEQRRLEFGEQTPAIEVPSGKHILTTPMNLTASAISARVSGKDDWPENDALTMGPPPKENFERWWIGSSTPNGWRAMQPQDLPTDPLAYLSVAAIALNNIPADAISPVQQERIAQFVRDLGGGLVITGGEHAFAAGGYVGSTLEALSPLSSSPPLPQHHWIILVDSSGSMAAPAEGGSRWDRASAAAAELVRVLPPTDVVSIGDFARGLRWWSQSRLAAATAKLPLPPKEIYPQGPTNLQAALQLIAASFEGPVAAEIILISDADASIDNPDALANLLHSKNIHLHLLATADASNSVVPRIAEQTGGHVSTQLDSKLWSDSMRKLQRGAISDGLQRIGTTVTFNSEMQAQPSRSVEMWNMAWLRRGATELASAGPGTTGRAVLAAHWRAGSGRVAAAAFEPTAQEFQELTNLVARPPRDPRFKVHLNEGPERSIRVDATDGDKYLNDLNIKVALSDFADISQARSEIALSQTAPGRYEATLPPSRIPLLASLSIGDQVIERIPISGRYAPEFDHIGNNRPAMQALAQSTGGAVIEPSQSTPIDFKWPKERISLTSILATMSAVLVAAGLLVWKIQ